MSTAAPSPEVPGREEPKLVSFPSADAPIQAVTVFCKNKAEVTRVVNFSSPSSLGRHEVELTNMPGRSLIDEASVRVKGIGHCVILHISYSDKPKDVKPEPTQEEKDEAKAKRKKTEQEIQRLTDELTVLNQQTSRNKHMREYADRFVERAMVATAGGSSNTTAVPGVAGDRPALAPSVDDVGKALDWWAARAAQTDAEVHRLELEGRRLKDAVEKLRKASRASLAAAPRVDEQGKKPPGRIQVTVDVLELGPIELEVKYMTRGATWSPSYDLRVDTQTDSISCTYYGMVTQSTTEDWKGVALRLSTAEPTVHGTPPALGSKLVSLKTLPGPVPGLSNGGAMAKTKENLPTSRRSSHGEGEDREGGVSLDCDRDSDMLGSRPRRREGKGGGGLGPARHELALRRTLLHAPRAPPPPPQAKPVVAQVQGGSGGMGSVSFVIDKPADIKSGESKKLTVGVLQLSVEVTHYIVPSKEAAAYLQAKATNNTDYLLLASNDVSIFFDNSFVTKTSLTTVSPGESFQTFLGIDPAVKITVAPPRKTSKKRGIFSKSNHVTHTHSASISNKKKVPVTCVIVDAIPRSTDEIIKVVLKQPTAQSVSESEAITDDVLVSAALEMFGEASSSDAQTPPPPTLAVTGVTGVLKSPSNHLAWVGKITPQDEISIPLEYTVEWPTGKEIKISGYNPEIKSLNNQRSPPLLTDGEKGGNVSEVIWDPFAPRSTSTYM